MLLASEIIMEKMNENNITKKNITTIWQYIHNITICKNIFK